MIIQNDVIPIWQQTPGFFERHWLVVIISVAMLGLGVGVTVWIYSNGDPAKQNPGAYILVASWSLCYALLDYKVALAGVRKDHFSDRHTKDREGQEEIRLDISMRIVVARVVATMKSVGVCGVMIAGLMAFQNLQSRPYDAEWEGFRFLQSIDVPILVYNDQLTIIYANDAAAKFYHVDRLDLIGKDPQQLHEWARAYMDNYGEFATEQMNRNTAARERKLRSKSLVPMEMNQSHNYGERSWYLTSKNVFIRGERYLVTRFSQTGDEP